MKKPMKYIQTQKIIFQKMFPIEVKTFFELVGLPSKQMSQVRMKLCKKDQ